MAHWIVRWRNALIGSLGWLAARKAQEFSKGIVRRIAERSLPDGCDVDTHFKPPYQPWDQRLCLMVGADLKRAIRAGDLDVVTDHIDHVIVTATGIQLRAFGGVTISVDGDELDPHDRFVFRRHLLEDVPNAAWRMGYTNGSWTLGADPTARSVAKLLAYMDSHGYTHAYPHLGGVHMPQQRAFNLQSGYALRSPDVLPKEGTRRPWCSAARIRRPQGRVRPAQLRPRQPECGLEAVMLASLPNSAGGHRGGRRCAPSTAASGWRSPVC